MSDGLAALNAITDAVLAYRPKRKRKRAKAKKRIARRKAEAEGKWL